MRTQGLGRPQPCCIVDKSHAQLPARDVYRSGHTGPPQSGEHGIWLLGSSGNAELLQHGSKFSSSSKHFVAHDIPVGFSTRSASIGTVKPIDNERCVTWSASFRLESMPTSTPARSEETEVVVDACLGDGTNIWPGVNAAGAIRVGFCSLPEIAPPSCMFRANISKNRGAR